MKHLVPILFLILLFFEADSQDYMLHSKFYGVEEGLSHRDVQCIHQDSLGFMWFGTKYGLHRFDGVHFKLFTEEKHGLQSNEINHILEDQKNTMWLFRTSSFNNYIVRSIDLFDPVTQIVQSFQEKFGETAPFSPDEVINFTQNEAGHLAFLTKKNQLITYTDQFKVHPFNFGLYEEIETFHWAPDGSFWVVVQEERKLSKAPNFTLYMLSESGELRSTQKHHPSSYIHIYDFTENGTVKYIVAHFDHIQNIRSTDFFLIDSNGQRQNDTLSSRFFKNSPINLYTYDGSSHFKINHGDYWIFTGNDQRFTILDTQSGSSQFLDQDYPHLASTTDVFFDRWGSIWVGTRFGIYRFTKQKRKFRKYLYNLKEKGRARNFECRGMTVDNHNHLWVMVENNDESVWQVNLSSNEEKELPKIPDESKKVRLDGTKYAITSDKEGGIYAAIGANLFYFDPQTLKPSRTLINKNGNDTYTWLLHQDKFNKIWFANDSGEIECVGKENMYILLDQSDRGKSIYSYQLVEDESDTAWLATNSGLFTINLENGKLLNRFWSQGKGTNYLPYQNVHGIHKDENNSFWLGTANNGLVHWSPSQGVIERYTRADGLPNNTIYAIYEDDVDNFWMSSDFGIIKFNKKTHHIKSYSEKDGLSHNEFNRISHYRDKNGNIYFGGLNGVTAFHPKDLIEDSLLSNIPLVLTSFQQFDGSQNRLVEKTGELHKSKKIILDPNDRFFRLEFALLTYSDTENIQYAYKVEGVDEDWTYQRENSIRLSRLPFGKHHLHIKGQLPNGQWSTKELTYSVNVLKPFYLQAGFIISMVLSFLLAIYLSHKRRVRMLQTRQIELEQVVEERTRQISEDKKVIEKQAEELQSLEKLKSRFFANVSHELRTPLTLMLGPVNSLMKRNEKNKTDHKLLQFVQRNGRQLQKLINEILDLSKLENNKLEVVEESIHFYPYLKEQLAQFHSFAVNDRLHLELISRIDESLKILLDKNKFEKIIHNFLSNAMKFTPHGGNVTLTVSDTDEHVQLEVKDTGKGIHPEDLPHIFDRFYQSKQPDAKTEGGTGIGLSLCKELAELLGGNVWAESELGKGSTFYFKFPKKTRSHAQIESEITVTEISSKQDSIPDIVEEVSLSETITTDQKVLGKANILIVEDNDDLCEYLKFILSDYRVITSENGKDALEKLTTPDKPFTPDLIISDLMMPVMDGFQLLERLKSDDRWRHLPTIMLTAKVNARARLRALRIGVDDYLTKPFQEEELKARIENLLHNYRERMTMFANREDGEEKDPEVEKPVIAEVDAQWLEKVEGVFSKQLSDGSLNLDFAAGKLHISVRQLRRRLKQLIGLTPNQYLQEMRLQQAREHLIHGRYATIKEASYAVGFTDTRYFSNLFQKRFGTRPSGVLNN